MLRPTAVSVTVLPDYCLEIQFNNGESRIFNVKPYIKGSWFGALRDADYFRSVSITDDTIEWPDGQDICPDDLYYGSVPIGDF